MGINLGKELDWNCDEFMGKEQFLKQCAIQFPLLLGLDSKDEARELMNRKESIRVRFSEIKWKGEVPLTNEGVIYNEKHFKREMIMNLLNELLSKGQIRRLDPSDRARVSPILFLKKSDGRLRPVNDYRGLNKWCDAWNTEFSGTMTTVRQVPHDWIWFTCVDLPNGFHQLPVDSESSKLFGFEALGRRFAWTVLPQGWACSSGLFHSRVRDIVADLPVISYVDDLLIGGRSLSEHNRNVSLVMERLESWGFQVNVKKIQWRLNEIQFLGVNLSSGTFSFKNYLERMTIPRTEGKRSLRRAIGMLNFTLRACPNLSQILAPLYDLLKMPVLPRSSEVQKLVESQWKLVLERNLEVWRNCPDDGVIDWNLYCDWSDEGQGYALFIGKQELGRIVSLNSTVHLNQYKESSFLGEFKTLIWALREVTPIIHDDSLTLWTDIEATQRRLLNCPKPIELTDKRISRCYGLLLENFAGRLNIRWVKGKENYWADNLSRWYKVKRTVTQGIQAEAHVIDEEDEEKALRFAHEGHWGIKKTYRHLKRANIHMKRMYHEVREFVRRRPQCQANAGKELRERFRYLPVKDFNDACRLKV